jgi:hypothetical protein
VRAPSGPTPAAQTAQDEPDSEPDRDGIVRLLGVQCGVAGQSRGMVSAALGQVVVGRPTILRSWQRAAI